MTPSDRNQLIDSLLDGDISEADFIRLEAEFSVNPEARQAYYQRLALSAMLQTEAGAAPNRIAGFRAPKTRSYLFGFLSMAAAVAALFAVNSLFLHPKKDELATNSPAGPTEQKASGFAILSEQSDLVWKNRPSIASGSLLPTGSLSLQSGLAQIELFSGVSVIIEGEADFEILSSMEMKVTRGKVRARVPEPALGFRIHTSEGQVVDLGTEFALDVSKTKSEVHVLDGQVEWHPKTEVKQLLSKGEGLRLVNNGGKTSIKADEQGFVGLNAMSEKLASNRSARRGEWMRFNEKLRNDPRLVALFHMGPTGSRQLPNESGAGAQFVKEGAVVGASHVADRWGVSGEALDFSATVSRVRMNIPGEYRSLSMFTWVKINSLDRKYNSLFLTDGHDPGEPHWQIMNDGRVFFGVKKRPNSEPKNQYPFYSPSIWNASTSGQWLMLAAVYDVEQRQVTLYLNGQPISQEAIPAEFMVENVTLGQASLCNWGLPLRNDPEFAIRNFNGSMDEFALFSAALTPSEIKDIYDHGKP